MKTKWHSLGAFITMFTLCLLRVATGAVNLPLEQMGVPERTFNIWEPLPLAVKEELRRLLDAGPAELELLLASADPREVGLGLFVLEQKQDLDRLVTLVDLLDDHRSTVPYAAPLDTYDVYIPVEQTVGEYLAHIYAMWFGVPPEQAAARKEELRNIGDPWARPYPWLKRLQRADDSERYVTFTLQERDQRVAEVKAAIAVLPSEVRWAIVMDRLDRGDYSQAEARAALLALDQSVRDQIMTGDPLAARADDIGWRLHDNDLTVKARALLQE